MGLARLIQRANSPAPFVGGAGTDSWDAGAGYPGTPVGEQTAVGYPAVPGGPVSFASRDGSVMALSAAWRCQHILSDGIGALDVFAYDNRERDARIDSPKILSDPWPVVTPVEWRGMVVSSLVMHGNCYLLPFDEDPRTGYPRQLPMVDPTRMEVAVKDGVPRYYIDGRVEVECLHIRGFMLPGHVVGMGVIEAQRRGIQLATDMDHYQGANFQQSSVPPVVIKVNRPEISDEQALDIQSRWMSRHGWGNRGPAVLPTSMDVEPVAWSPEDTQFLESKQYQAAEVCWWFGVDPRILGLSASGQSLTYSNIESTYVDLQRMSMMPWTSRIEASLSRVMPRHHLARFDFSPILRTTLQDRYNAYKTGLDGGWLTVEEVRAMENLGPLGQEPQGIGGGGIIESIGGAKDNKSLPALTEAVEVA